MIFPMRLKSLEISGFKSFAKKAVLAFDLPVTAIVGPNGSGKSNVAEAFRFVLGEQSVKSLRGKKGEDLIFAGGKTMARQNRATVKVVFDNTDRRLPIEFDEVSLERIVHRDGLNDYFINGSRVRLKDIAELLAHAHIGSSGHHIISQGEADHILIASPADRREMIEDALGLKIYHYRKRESERKLDKTEENIRQVESLRREIAPHLSFLRKQVEKLERARELKDKLAVQYKEYLKRESLYISFSRKAFQEEKGAPERALRELAEELGRAEAAISKTEEHGRKEAELRDLDGKMQAFIREKDALSRDMGRIEGELSFIARLEAQRQAAAAKEQLAREPQTVAFSDVRHFADEVSALLEKASSESDASTIVRYITDAKERIRSFFNKIVSKPAVSAPAEDHSGESKELAAKKESLAASIGKLEGELSSLQAKAALIRSAIDSEKEGSRSAERAVYEIKARQNEAVSALAQIKLREEKLAEIEAEWKRESSEAVALLGHSMADIQNFTIAEAGKPLSDEQIVTEVRSAQEDRKRQIERAKIRLEEAGLGTGEEVLKEYEETASRDEFLKKEVADLHAAAASLQTLIADLETELKKRFTEGMTKITERFNEYFQIMFGGGEASLEVVQIEARGTKTEGEEEAGAESVMDDEDAEAELGVDVHVSLPHKRVKGLTMLSGGERALTSIALLFAVSQVNPPPFIILDETDAALDEANSRKYGDMIESLAKQSQLILITHNRETMSRAGVLYGVTMSREGFSTLLSIRFEEAVKVAK